VTNGSSDVNNRTFSLPELGPGSRAGWGRRIVALFVDWLIANVLVLFATGGTLPWSGELATWLPLLAWAVLVWLSTSLTGASLGQHLLKLRVIRLDRRPVGLLKGGVRTVLIALVIPPLVLDGDGRGLHDVAVGTVVVHGPRSRQ
jgi:uncharacterized RDD family membrane protein YckC